MLKDAMAVWKALEGQVRKTVRDMNGKSLQCERYDVTSAPNAVTGKIGVSQPYGEEIQIPYSTACAQALPGDSVMVFWWKSLSNAKAWFMGDRIGDPAPEMQQILNAVYPVGSLYMSEGGASPDTLFGGTWEQTDVQPYAAVTVWKRTA